MYFMYNFSGGMKCGVEENARGKERLDSDGDWRAAPATKDDEDSPSTQELPGISIYVIVHAVFRWRDTLIRDSTSVN